jgi:hypothetical protein
MFVFEMGADFGFTQKTRAGRHIMYKVGTNNFNRYCAAKSAELMRQVNLTHATHIDATHQVIITKAG